MEMDRRPWWPMMYYEYTSSKVCYESSRYETQLNPQTHSASQRKAFWDKIEGYVILYCLAGPLQLRPSRYCCLPAKPAAVCAECRCSAPLFSSGVRTHNHTAPWYLHWLRVPERIQFRLCVPAYHCVHGTAPEYLADSLRPTSEFVARRHLRSADTTTLLVPPTRRVTLGDLAFPVAAARAWNSLPAQIRATSSLLSFRRQTKAHLFQLSYNWLHHPFLNLICKVPL